MAHSISEAEKKSYEFEIAGMPYKLKSSHDERTVRELVEYVDQKVKQALAQVRIISKCRCSGGIKYAEELILLKHKAQHELDALELKAVKISHDLNNSRINRKGMNV